MKHIGTENFSTDYFDVHSVQYDMFLLMFWCWTGQNCLVPICHVKVDSGHSKQANCLVSVCHVKVDSGHTEQLQHSFNLNVTDCNLAL
jgi:hypothetical protein